MAIRSALALLLCIVAPGCLAPKRANLVVPRRCIRIVPESFTRPCSPRSDGKLVCDGVVVTATCVAVKQ